MVSEQQVKRLHKLTDAFLEENGKLNLSAMRTQDACWHGNVLDSLGGIETLQEWIMDNEKLKIADIGTGGGFPLLPLAMLYPDALFTGIDSVQKKLDAIKRITDTLNLENVQLCTGRLEELGRSPHHRELYDIVTARAVAPLNTLLEYAAPLVKVGGHILCWKSLKIEQELQESLLARAEFSTHLIKKNEYELPGDWGTRQILVFEKTSPLHKKYPRDVGVPKKEPLI